MKITPFVGIGNVILGSTKEQVKDLIGKPDKNNRESLGDGAYSEEWEYTRLGLELFFIGSDELDYISVSSSKAEIHGIYPIGMDIKVLTEQIPEIKFDEDYEDSEASYIYPEKEISFWVVGGVVTDLTIFPNDNNIDEKNHPNKAKNWGLRENVEREFTDQKISYWFVWGASWLTWIYMVCGFAIGGYYIWPFLEDKLDQKAIEHGLEITGLLYDTNFGIGLLLFIIVWIITAALLTGLTVFLAPAKLKHTLFWGALDDDGGKPYNKKALKIILENAKSFSSAKELIHSWCKQYIRYALIYIIPLTIIGLPLLYLDMNSYSIYTKEGIYRSYFLPWENDGLKPWNTADYVELGCNQTDDGPSIVYDITFNDGSSKRIEDGVAFTDYSWLESLEIIDQQLSEAGTEFQRWKWNDRDPLHPQCIRGYYGYLGAKKGDRLIQLLRVGEFKGEELQ